MSLRDTTTIGVPKAVKQRFEALKVSKYYKSFHAFVNQIVLEEIKKIEERETV